MSHSHLVVLSAAKQGATCHVTEGPVVPLGDPQSCRLCELTIPTNDADRFCFVMVVCLFNFSFNSFSNVYMNEIELNSQTLTEVDTIGILSYDVKQYPLYLFVLDLLLLPSD